MHTSAVYDNERCVNRSVNCTRVFVVKMCTAFVNWCERHGDTRAGERVCP
jgi:hypothetical protein